MRSIFIGLLNHIRASFWFLPALMTISALLSSLLLVNFDESTMANAILAWSPIPQTGVEGARLMVSTIAGSMITVASLVFSLTLISLTLVSQQLGPRILPIFMTDRSTQIVLGYFVATFLFSLVVLSTIGSGEKGEFVPQLSVQVLSLIAVSAFALIIYFIHHIARSIQADSVVVMLATSLNREIAKTLKSDSNVLEIERSDDQRNLFASKPIGRLTVSNSGYVQWIDYERVKSVASKSDFAIRFLRGPGHFVLKGTTVVEVFGTMPDDEAAASVIDCIELGPQRTPAHQVEYEFNALLEVALRALSPGINDPFTAITSIDHLTDGLARVLKCMPVETLVFDDDGIARLDRYRRSFETYMTLVMNPLRQSANPMPQVVHRLAEALQSLHQICEDEASSKVILHHARQLSEDCCRETPNENDRADILSLLSFVEGVEC